MFFMLIVYHTYFPRGLFLDGFLLFQVDNATMLAYHTDPLN